MNTTEYIASAIERETGISFASLMSAHPILGITTEDQRVAIVRVISDGNRQQTNAMETALEIVTMLKRWDIFTPAVEPVTDTERMEKLEDNYRAYGDC
tara:strand:+ start:196 stop:489 length:294 start_codon:yes stop_codon:yes gene_type:complete